MSIREEFENAFNLAKSAGVNDLSRRMTGFLNWMNERPEIKTILNDLRSNGPVPQLVQGEDPQRLTKAREIANSHKDVAAVALFIMELCSIVRPGHPQMLFHQAAFSFGIQPDSGDLDPYNIANAAITSYIDPFYDYVMGLLPEDPSPAAITVVAPFIPVAIQESLVAFQKDYPNPEKVAFIMMQFGDTTAHTSIESAIKDTLKKYSFTGVLARDKEYHDEMLPNIQTYMHGCGFGIAVFERIQKEVFNPNVSLEVGYMIALKKRVLLMKDQTLTALQTDLVGRLYRSFDVQHPDKTIPKQVEAWMEEKGLI